MSHYPFFIPEFMQSTNSSLFGLKIVNEFRNYLSKFLSYTGYLL